MIPEHFPSYRLRQDILESFLRELFPTEDIQILAIDGYYRCNLPRHLHEGELRVLRELRGRSKVYKWAGDAFTPQQTSIKREQQKPPINAEKSSGIGKLPGRIARRQTSDLETASSPDTGAINSFTDFTRRLEASKVAVADQYGTNRAFIPLQALESAWGQPTWQQFILNDMARDFDISVKERLDSFLKEGLSPCLRIASIILWSDSSSGWESINLLQNMLHIGVDDSQLPLGYDHALFRARPSGYQVPHQMISRMIEVQALFNPSFFETNWVDRPLPDTETLPITHIEELARGAYNSVYKIKIHQSGNSLVPQDINGKPTVDTFVLKTYRDTKKEYLNEVDFFTRLKTEKSSLDHIITYYGSFSQASPSLTYNIVLEYANGGSLLDFFQSDNPPIIADELMKFWKALLKLSDGLSEIHRLQEREVLLEKCAHGDIKPSNILVFKKSSSRFDFHFKLADFGTSGSQMYSSPETYKSEITEDSLELLGEKSSGSPKEDIWSLGCVLSEAAVWSVMGETARHEYRQLRTMETTKTDLEGTGYDGCFHNAHLRLDSVDLMHHTMLSCVRSADTITCRISPFILQSILQTDPLNRLTAAAIYESGMEIIHFAKGELVSRDSAVTQIARSPRILSLDGGGIRGVIALLVLKSMMQMSGGGSAKPSDYFDLIVGAGTGGLIAILLGRLDLSIDECIHAYISLARSLFERNPSHEQHTSAIFSSVALNETLKSLLVRYGQSEDAMLRQGEDRKCRVLVCAMSTGVSFDIRLRSYDAMSNLSAPLFDCLIREAARATVAVPTLFDTVTIGGTQFIDGGRSIDGGIGITNPINIAWDESKSIWGSSCNPVMVSISAGMPMSAAAMINAQHHLGPELCGVVNALAVSAALTASRFVERHWILHREASYFRLGDSHLRQTNDEWLDDWEQLEHYKTHNNEYFGGPQTSDHLRICAKVLTSGRSSLSPDDYLVLQGYTTSLSPQTEIASGADSIISDSGYSSSSTTENLEDILVSLFRSHESCQALLSILSNALNPQVFQTAVAVLLSRYAHKLSKTASNSGEKLVARYILSRCEDIATSLLYEFGDISISARLRGIDRFDDASSAPHDSSHRGGIRRSKAMENYLVRHISEGAGNREISDPNDHSSASHKGVPDDNSRLLQALDHARQFLVSGDPFEEFTTLLGYWAHEKLLHMAVYDNNIDDVKSLLENGWTIREKDHRGMTVVAVAVGQVNLRMTKLLLRSEGEVATISSSSLLAVRTAAETKWSEDIEDSVRIDLAEIIALLSPKPEEIPPSGYADFSFLVAHWDVPKAIWKAAREMENIRDPQETLCKFVALTGSDTKYCCTTCEDYMQDQWGTVGKLLIDFLGQALKGLFVKVGSNKGKDSSHEVFYGRGSDTVLEKENTLLSDLNMVAKVSMESITVGCLDPSGNEHYRVVVDALRWLITAVRVGPSVRSDRTGIEIIPRLYKSTASLGTTIEATSLGSRQSPELKLLTLGPLLSLKEADLGLSCCWTKLFEVGIVAWRSLTLGRPPGLQKHFDLIRGWGLGLQMNFDLMVHLSGVGTYYLLPSPSTEDGEGNPGLILVGFRTALIPIAKIGGSIQWHLEYSETRPINPQQLASTRGSWLRIQDPMVFQRAVCYVGWYENADILLGTSLLLSQVSLSNSIEKKRRIEPIGFSIGAQAGLSGGPLSPIALNIQPAAQFVFSSNRQRFNPLSEYSMALTQMAEQVALVFDTTTQQAWLVPGLSLHLHMCHQYFLKYKDVWEVEVNHIPFADPSPNGSLAALKALKASGHVRVFQSQDSCPPHKSQSSNDLNTEPPEATTLWQVFQLVNRNLLESTRTREDPKKSKLWGAELIDMLSPPGAVTGLREVKHKQMQPWLPLAATADIVMVCSNLGHAIRPSPLHDGAIRYPNCKCCDLPDGKFYLAAHTWCLAECLRRARYIQNISDLEKGECQLGKHRWSLNTNRGSPWIHCPHDRSVTSIWGRPERFVQDVSKDWGKLEPQKLGCRIPATGVLVFGQF